MFSQRSNDWACAWFKHLLFHHTKFPRSTSATRAISVLSLIILPLQTFVSRVLLLRQLAFSSENLPPERPTTTTTRIKAQDFCYERINSTRKFAIVAEIVSLLKKIYKRDAPFRAVFKVKTLAVLFPPYLHEMKTNTRNLNLPPFCRLLFSMEMVQPIPTCALSHTRGLSMRTHLTAVKPMFSLANQLTERAGKRARPRHDLFLIGWKSGAKFVFETQDETTLLFNEHRCWQHSLTQSCFNCTWGVS